MFLPSRAIRVAAVDLDFELGRVARTKWGSASVTRTVREAQLLFTLFYAITWGHAANSQPRWSAFAWSASGGTMPDSMSFQTVSASEFHQSR